MYGIECTRDTFGELLRCCDMETTKHHTILLPIIHGCPRWRNRQLDEVGNSNPKQHTPTSSRVELSLLLICLGTRESSSEVAEKGVVTNFTVNRSTLFLQTKDNKTKQIDTPR